MASKMHLTKGLTSNYSSERWFLCGLVTLFFAAAGWLSVHYFSYDGRIASLWLANAILIGVICRRTDYEASPLILAASCGSIAANLLSGDNWQTAALLAAANALEMSLAVLIIRQFCVPKPDLENLQHLGLFVLTGLIVPIVPASIAAMTLARGGSWFDPEVWTHWYAAHSLLIPILAPLTIILLDWRHTRTLQNTVSLSENGLLSAIVLFFSITIFVQTSFPLLFLACPVVLLVAFRRRLTGTALAVTTIALFSIVATYNGIGPISLVDGDMRTRLVVLQLFLAACFSVGLPVVAVHANRAKVREELRESRDFVEAIVDGVGNVIFKTDQAGHWIFLNASWTNLTGFSIEESLGTHSAKLVDTSQTSELQQTFKAIEAGQVSATQVQQKIRIADGSSRHVEVSIRRLSDNDGAFLGTVGSITDISEKLAGEHALLESEARFRTMAEAAPVGIFQADSAGKITYLNKRWAAMFGMPVEELLGDGWRKALATGKEFRDDPAFKGFNKPGDIRQRKACFRHTDGTDIWIETVNAAEFDSEGQVTGFVGVFIDITDRKSAEAALVQREEQLALLANNATDTVLRLSLDGICLYASPSTQKLMNVAPELLVGQQMIAGFHPDDDAGVRSKFAEFREGVIEQAIFAFRSEKLDQPGEYWWMEASCGLVRCETSGEPIEIIASLRDVGLTKALEAELRDARRAAEAAAEAKSSFLTNMSHEIRTPMNGVIGFTELLLSDELSEIQRERAELIADSGRSMLRLLNDILDMAKIEAGQSAINYEAVDVRHKLNGSIRLLEAVAQRKGLALSLEVEGDVPNRIMSDPLRLRQILLNLTGNAIKFTESGSVAVTAAIAHGSGSPMLNISVTDTGIGIAPDRIEQVFEQFTQADLSITRRFGGTGLGLSISAQLARLMGGTLQCSSAIGEGSTFTLSIPLIEALREIEEAKPNDTSPEVGSAYPRGAARILVAEDHDINQLLIRQMFSQAGYEIEIAENGSEAFEMVHSAQNAGQPFNIVFMDMQMPVLDGLEATRKIRAAGFDKIQLPIIALTANAHSDDIALCLASGMQAHIGKPVRSRDLIAAVFQWAVNGTARPIAIDDEIAKADLDARFTSRKREAAEAIARALRDGCTEPKTIEELVSHFHKIAGSAAYFDQVELGNRSSVWENEIRTADPDKLFNILRAALSSLAA